MDKALQTMIDNMPEKTGKKLTEWLEILATTNFEKHSLAVNFLKKEHGVSHGFANTIVTLSKEKENDTEDLVFNQYIGKGLLTPIYDMLIAIIEQFGDDVVIAPKKASVSLIRKKQFALIKPATKTRIDLGLKLKDIAVQGRLEDSGPFGTMCTHSIRLESVADVDNEVIDWLLIAYQQSI